MLIKIYAGSVEYHGISNTVERDIFQRVQMGVTLTAAGLFLVPPPKLALLIIRS